MHLICYYPYYSCLCTFWPHMIPTYFFNVAFYTCLCQFFSKLWSCIAAEGHGLSGCRWHEEAMQCANMAKCLHVSKKQQSLHTPQPSSEDVVSPARLRVGVDMLVYYQCPLEAEPDHHEGSTRKAL